MYIEFLKICLVKNSVKNKNPKIFKSLILFEKKNKCCGNVCLIINPILNECNYNWISFKINNYASNYV